MRAMISGVVIETEKDSMNGTPFYGAYLRLDGDKPRDAAQRVKINAEQYGALSEGDEVDWPVLITLDSFEGRRPRMSVRLDPDYDVRAGARPSPMHSVG